MIDVAALTSGWRVPSARFRVRQYVELLKRHGIRVREWVPPIDKNRPLPLWPTRLHVGYVAPAYLAWEAFKAATRLPGVVGSWRADVTWLQRELLPGYPTFERVLSRPIVFDVDDAIWVARPFGASAIAATARRAEVVVVGNSYLGEWFADYARDIRIIPTAIDTDRFRPRSATAPDGRERNTFTIGWTGTAGNLHYLEQALPAVRAFMKDHADVELLIVADKPPGFRVPAGRLRYVPWSPATEAEVLWDLDVGIMPLPDTEWTRGKCGFKLLQYMATGVPVVASPVGMNNDILAMADVGFPARDTADWRTSLESLYRDPRLRNGLGATGRETAVRHFDRAVATELLTDVFEDVA